MFCFLLLLLLWQDSNLVPHLHEIYKTLVNQTAHIYFIHEQQNIHAKRKSQCMDREWIYNPSKPRYHPARTHARKVANDFFVVGSNLRGLMCQFQQAFILFDKPVQTKQIVSDVLSHRFRISSVCSRMQIVDCQLMRNSLNIFNDIGRFLRQHSHRLFNEILLTKSRTL